MNGGQYENFFNDLKARELVYYLLEKDIPTFKKLIPEIRTMDSNSFKNLFQGIPFKNPENPEGYDYKVINKKQFEKLIDKFDNFFILLDSWYHDKKYYSYLEDLWINYVSIEKLRDMNENNREIFLDSYEIDYKHWPRDIKISFKRLIRSATNTRIFTPQKVEEIKKAEKEFNYLLKEMLNFKHKIETEPEMVTYEKNTDKFIDKIKPITNWLKELINGKSGKLLSALGSLPTIFCFFDINETASKSDLDFNNDFNDNDNWCDENDNFEQNSNDSDLEELIKKFLDNTDLGLYIYSSLSFIHLGLSVYEFINAYKDLKEIKKNIKGQDGYKTSLNKIKANFNLHKEKIGILPDDFKESLRIIKEVFMEIMNDYNELQNIINKINKDIAIAKEHKSKSAAGLVSAAALGIVGGILTKNPNSLLYGFSLASNILSGVGHTLIFIDSSLIIEKLDKILKEAKSQKEEIKTQLNELIKIISDLEKGLLPKIEKKIVLEMNKQ